MPRWDGVIAPTMEGRGGLFLAVRGEALGRCGVGGWWPIEEQPRSAGPGRLRRLRRPAKLFELRARREQRRAVVFEIEFFGGLPGPSTAGNPPRSGGQTPGPPATHPAAAPLQPKQSADRKQTLAPARPIHLPEVALKELDSNAHLR